MRRFRSRQAASFAWRLVFFAVSVCVQAPFIRIQTQARALRVVLKNLIEKRSIQIKRCRNEHSRGLATDWVSLAGEEGELAQGSRGGDTGMPRIAGETARGALVSGTGDGHDVVREPGWPVNASKYSRSKTHV